MLNVQMHLLLFECLQATHVGCLRSTKSDGEEEVSMKSMLIVSIYNRNVMTGMYVM